MAIVLAVVLLGIAVLARLDGQLRGALDRTLRQRAVEVARLSASTPKLLTAPGALEGRLGGSSLFVQAGRALRPLRRLSWGARTIARTGDASQRLAVPATRDEVGDLAQTRNAMLASLERAREAERRFVGDASHELRTADRAARQGRLRRAARCRSRGARRPRRRRRAPERAAGRPAGARARGCREPARGEPVDLVAIAREAAAADPGANAVVAAGSDEVLARGERAALERAAGNLVRNARRHGPAGGQITLAAASDGERARLSVSDEGSGLRPDEAARAFERFWRGPGAYAIAATVAALAVTGGIAQAALRSSDPSPAPKPLAAAVLDALRAPRFEGLTARIHFTNHLLPGGTLPAGASSPLAGGADGRLSLTADGRFRLDLTSGAGQAQVASDGKQLTLYDSTSKTLYTLPLPAAARSGAHGAAGGFGLQSIQSGLGDLMQYFSISDAKPSSTAGRPTYTVRIAPRDDGGLLGAAEVAWDAERGVPLRAAVYAQGESQRVLELKATEISYGAVSAAQVAPTPHPDARRVRVDAGDLTALGRPTKVTGVDAVARRLDFRLAAPAEIAGLARRQVYLVESDAGKGAVSVYGHGLGSIVVFQGKATGRPLFDRRDLPLPQVNIDGQTGTELATPLGTILTFERDGVSHVVGGLVPRVAAENAARDLH